MTTFLAPVGRTLKEFRVVCDGCEWDGPLVDVREPDGWLPALAGPEHDQVCPQDKANTPRLYRMVPHFPPDPESPLEFRRWLGYLQQWVADEPDPRGHVKVSVS